MTLERWKFEALWSMLYIFLHPSLHSKERLKFLHETHTNAMSGNKIVLQCNDIIKSWNLEVVAFIKETVSSHELRKLHFALRTTNSIRPSIWLVNANSVPRSSKVSAKLRTWAIQIDIKFTSFGKLKGKKKNRTHFAI